MIAIVFSSLAGIATLLPFLESAVFDSLEHRQVHLQGTWYVTFVEKNGKPDEELFGATLTVRRDQVSLWARVMPILPVT